MLSTISGSQISMSSAGQSVDAKATRGPEHQTSNGDVASIPAWRKWVVQWDMSHMAIPLAFFAFTSMWQTASMHYGMRTVPQEIWIVLYFTSCIILAVTCTILCLRIFVYPAAIVKDFKHPRLMNFFYTPVIIGSLCILTTPRFMRTLTEFRSGFYILAVYQVFLALYLFGEWLFGSHPTIFIHPLVFMQTIGFFLLANIAASIHWIEHAWSMFSVGMLFWLLVFFTNFQHVAIALDKRREKPTPTFFLFLAPPAQAAVALFVLSKATHAVENGVVPSAFVDFKQKHPWPVEAKLFLHIDLFLYLLVFRLFPTFWTAPFSITWWAYIFPLSAASSVTIWRYSCAGEVFWGVLAALMSIIACFAMVVVLGFTLWSLWSGTTPKNPSILSAYIDEYRNQHGLPGVESNDLESGLSSNCGASSSTCE